MASIPACGFRVAVPVEELSPGDIDLIMQAKVETDEPYDLSDIPDEDCRPPVRRSVRR
jgi:hypothetical protein